MFEIILSIVLAWFVYKSQRYRGSTTALVMAAVTLGLSLLVLPLVFEQLTMVFNNVAATVQTSPATNNPTT